jgi:recombination protein RecT
MSTSDALTVISGDIYASRNSFDAALVDRSISFEREAGFAIQILAGNSYAMKIALNNRQSVVDAVVNVAAIGISLNPAKRQAYLVPRKDKICLDISYMGLMDLAQATGSVKWAQASLVYASDTFALNGLDKPPTHVFNPFSKERGEIVGVYCTVKTIDGDYLTHTMTIDEAHAIRDRSEAWKASKSGPWKTDPGEMIKKTCVKQASKYWPTTDRIDSAIHHLNVENGEGLAVIAEEAKQIKGPIIPACPPTHELDISPQRLQIVEAVASSIADHFANDDVVGAYEEYIGITDSEEKMALKNLLPSNVRSAIKKHGLSLKEPVTA